MNSRSRPPLPTIDNFDLLLEVCTHKDIRPSPQSEAEWGDNDRLADLGAKVLDAVVTYHLFQERPCRSAEEIVERRDELTHPNMLDEWLEYYNLKAKLRVPPQQSHEIYSDKDQMAVYFHTYLGALFMTKGISPIQIWISKLIDPNSDPENYPAVTQRSSQEFNRPSVLHTPPSTVPSPRSSIVPSPPVVLPPPLPSTPFSEPTSLVSLSLVNQTAMQKGLHVSYTASAEGPPHQPTWTVQCFINNELRGQGQGKSQKAAKEIAARQAWQLMGWAIV